MNEKDILITLVGAILLFLFLAGGIISFVILYYQRVRHHQLTLRDNELKQQLNLLNAAINAQEEERQRIGADIHDDIGPMLATTKLLLNKFIYLKNDAETKTHVKRVGEQLDEVIDQVRAVAKNLVPQVLIEFGLTEAVEELCTRISEAGALTAEFTFHQSLPQLQIVEQLALFRIIQEFCNNTLKHAEAQNLRISFQTNSNEFVVVLQDDGAGITVIQFDNPTGLGINNMQARARSIGAIMELEGRNPHGTTMVIRLKYKQ